jgi:hypothetical protein
MIRVVAGSVRICDRRGVPKILMTRDVVWTPTGIMHWHGADDGSIIFILLLDLRGVWAEGWRLGKREGYACLRAELTDVTLNKYVHLMLRYILFVMLSQKSLWFFVQSSRIHKYLIVGTLPSLILRLVHRLDLAQRCEHGGSVDQLKAI